MVGSAPSLMGTKVVHKATWVHEFRAHLQRRGIQEGTLLTRGELLDILVNGLNYSIETSYAKIRELQTKGILIPVGKSIFLLAPLH